MTPVSLSPNLLVLGALAVIGCQAGERSRVHGPNRLTVTKQVFGNADYKRRYVLPDGGIDGGSSTVEFDAATEAVGLTYERFIGPRSSILIGVQRRDYESDGLGFSFVSGEGLELLLEGRFYGRTKEALQPFVGGGILVGKGVEFTGVGGGTYDSQITHGVQAGGGAVYFHPGGFSAELGVQYEYTSIRSDPFRYERNEDEVQGLTGWLGLGWTF